MKKTLTILISTLLLGLGFPVPGTGDTTQEDVLVVRYASLIGGREAGAAPNSGEVLSPEELSDFLLEWEPESDNREVREVFALNELGELARQASQLPLTGGAISAVYATGDSSFEIDMSIRPARTLDSGDDVIAITAEIKRNGEFLSGPTIHTRLGERAIVSATAGSSSSFLFLVVEVDRVPAEELVRRGLRYSWRKDYMLVDGKDVTQPVVIEKPPPSYPEEARKAKFQGRVVLRMVINDEGAIEDVEVVEGQPYGLTEAAVEAARSWRFKPALHEGEPVAVFYLVTVNFRLE